MTIKDNIYNQYLSGKITEPEMVIALDLAQNKSIKTSGVIYTPWPIVQFMVNLCQPALDMKIIEPSCGHGIFIIGLLEHFRKIHTPKDIYKWLRHNLTAIDLSTDSIDDFKMILSLYFEKHFNIKLNPADLKNIVCADSLFYKITDSYDLCIGNPPYIRNKNLEKKYLLKIRSAFSSCAKGNIDIYYAFIEKYMCAAKVLCFITPNGFLTNVSGKALRNKILPELTHLVDFKDKLIFKDAQTYTCIFKTNIKTNSDQLLYASDINDALCTADKNKLFGFLSAPPSTNNVLSGLATLCDSAFTVNRKNGLYFANIANTTYPIEKEMVVPYLKLTKQRDSDFTNIKFMLYPYNKDNSIIPETTLKIKFPLAYTYLLAIKDRLLQRDRGATDKYEAWYAYGRKQGLHNIIEKTVIAVPLMIGGACKPFKLNIAPLLDEYEKIVFTSGFVIPLNKNNNKFCSFVLSQKFIDFAKQYGKAWPGKKDPYYSLTAKQVKGSFSSS